MDPARVSESRGSSDYTVSVTGQLNGATRTTIFAVTVSLSAGSATADDFTAVTPVTVNIPANQPSAQTTFRFRNP